LITLPLFVFSEHRISNLCIICRLDDVPVCRQDGKNRPCRYLSTAYKAFHTNGNTRLIYKSQSAYRLFSALLCSAELAGQGSSTPDVGSNATGTAVLYVSLCVLLCFFSCVFLPSLERQCCPTFSLCFCVCVCVSLP